MWPNLIGTSLGLGGFIASHDQKTPLIVGMNGAQGAGKSTMARLLACILEQVYGRSTLECSIDDFYLQRKTRENLAKTVHPLFLTRGVPGTHDLPLIRKTLNALIRAKSGQTVLIPRFNKALDDRCPGSEWRRYEGRPDIIILEGWCVGSIAEPESRLQTPVNVLEASEDPQGIWRKTVNDALKNGYTDLFSRLDLLIFLAIPDFSNVFEWRSLQEQKLVATSHAAKQARVLDSKALQRFIQHYERLTRWNLEMLPRKADLTLEVNASHAYSRLYLPTP